MRYRKQQIDIPLTQGVNQAIESRLSTPGGMKTLNNLVFDKQGRLVKRRRFSSTTLSTVSGSALTGTYPNKLASFGDRLLYATREKLYEFSPTVGRLSASRGSVPEAGAPVRSVITHDSKNDIANVGMVITSLGYRVYAWVTEGTVTAGQGDVWASIYSPDGNLLLTSLVSSIGGSTCHRVRIVTDGSYVLISWIQNATDLVYVRLNLGAYPPASVTWPATTLVTAAVSNSLYDVCMLGTDTYFVNKTGAATVEARLYDDTMALTTSNAVAAPTAPQIAFGCFADANGLCIAWGDLSDTYAAIWNRTTLAVIQASTIIIPTSATPSWVGGSGVGIINHPTTAGKYVIFAHHNASNSGSPLLSALMWAATFDTAGTVVTDGAPQWHCMLASRPMVYNSKVYAVLHTISTSGQLDGAYWLCELFYGDASSVRLPRPVAALAVDGLGNVGIADSGSQQRASLNDIVRNAHDTSRDGYEVALLETFKLSGGLWQKAVDYAYWQGLDTLSTTGVTNYKIEFKDPTALLPVELGRATFFSGGLLSQYDGEQLTEVGFCYRPIKSRVTKGAAAGNSYNYAFTFGWRDSQGQWHESAPGAEQTVTASGTPSLNPNTVDCQTLTLSNREDDGIALSIRQHSVVVRLWRTTNAGTVFYLLGEVQNDRKVEYVTFTDNVSDTTLATREALYCQPGASLPHGTADSAADLCVWKNRLVACKENIVRFTNEWLGDWAPQFVRGLTHQVPIGSIDPVTAVDVMDGTIVAFKNSGEIQLLGGEGPAPNGTPPLQPPRQYSSDLGCEDPRSLLASRAGLFFKSRAGIFLLPRGFGNLMWVGEAVKDEFGDPRHSSATLYPYVVNSVNVPDRNLALFILSSNNHSAATAAKILVLDYARGAWTTWDWPSLVVSPHVCVLDDVIYFAGGNTASTQFILTESQTATSEGAAHVPLTIESHKYRPTGQATGFARGYALRILGGVEGAAADVFTTVKLEVAVDDGAYQAAESWGLTGTSLDQTFILEHVLKYPKANSFQFRVTDAVDGSANPNNGPALNALTFDVVALPGGKPTPAANRS